jgi:hypothetical protein
MRLIFKLAWTALPVFSVCSILAQTPSRSESQSPSGQLKSSGLTIRRSEVPFGTVRAYRMTATYQGDIRPVVAKYGRGAVFFLQPPSDNGWSQKVHDIQVRVDGNNLTPNMKDWLDRPAYVIPVNNSSKDFFARIEFTQFDRVIKENDINPNPVTLSQADREKYTADYTIAKGIVDGKNKDALRQAGLLIKPGESEWDFVERVMQDCLSKKRWEYSEQKAEWPKNPSQWLQGANVGNCDDVNTYLVWLLRESKVPARQVSRIFPSSNGVYRGHSSIEFFSSKHGAWVPADLDLLVSGKTNIQNAIGCDVPSSGGRFSPRYLGSDDRSYYFVNAPSVGNIDVSYGSVPKFAAPKWGKAPVAVGSSPIFSQSTPVEIVN